MTRQFDNAAFNIQTTTYQPTAVLEVAQPLLRDAWPEFNLAKLHIAQVTEKGSEADFRAKVEEIVADVISAYWTLWDARLEVPIRQDLLDSARDTLEKVKARKDIDAAAAEIRQAEAAVKQREVVLEIAVKAVGDAQDALVKLLADPQVNLLSPFTVNPVSVPSQTRVTLDDADQLRAALEHNPILEKARLAIQLAELNIVVAKNQALPRLDFTGSGGYQGQARHSEDAQENLADLDTFDFAVGLSMEYPLGNRERLAELRRRRVERSKSVSQLQSVADQIAVAVKERKREIDRSYREIELNRELVESYRVYLQALEDIEKIRGRLTPEFLNLKLNTQSQLAEAKVAELRAIRTYNLALSDLARATGTILKEYSVDVMFPAATGEAPWPRLDEKPTPASSQTQSSDRRKRQPPTEVPIASE
jgi:outer membrane protein